jgi:tetratricopeptide (TPR) repeat protein
VRFFPYIGIRRRSCLCALIRLVLLFSAILSLAPGHLSAQTTFDSQAEAARSARESGDATAAIGAYQRALQIRPNWEEGLWYLGTLQYDADHYAEAAKAFRKLVELDSRMGPAWTFLGLCEFETREYDKSLSDLSKGQSLAGGDDPDLARVAQFHLGLLLIREGSFEKAAALLTSSLAGKPSAQTKTALGMALLRVPLLPNEVDPSQDGIIHAAGEAALLLLENDQANALQSLGDLAQQFPNMPYVHYVYGLALASAGRPEDALAQLNQELKISPASPLPLIEISKLELRAHHLDLALSAAEKAVQAAPFSAASHAALAEVLAAQDEKQKANLEASKAKALLPEKPAREARIVNLYSPRETNAAATKTAGDFDQLSRAASDAANAGDAPKAIEIYKQALEVRPDWYEGRWSLATLQFSSQKFADAIPTLKKCVAFKPDFGTAWGMLGLAEFELKDYNNALVHLQRGQDLGLAGSVESLQVARYRLGILLNQAGEFDRAADILGSVAESGPLMNDVQFAMGMSLLRVAALPDQVDAAKRNLMQIAGTIDLNLQKSKYDDAFAKFAILLRDYPQTPFLHYACGTAHAALSEYDQAETEYRKELSISPQSELPYVRLASLFLRQHRPADALPMAKKAVELKPDSAEARYMLGRSELETGDLENALKDLELAEKMAPSSPEVHFNLAKAYSQAKLPEKAKEERTIFAQLNALAQEQRSTHGVQTYGGSRDMSDFSTTGASDNHAPQQ